MTDEPRKAYYIERPSRTVTTFLVYANSAREAMELHDGGQDEVIGSETTGVGKGRARRAPMEDRSP